MHFEFENSPQCLRATLYGRQTAEETLQFVAALSAEARRHSASKAVRVALLAESDEVRASHQFRDEKSALRWLQSQE